MMYLFFVVLLLFPMRAQLPTPVAVHSPQFTCCAPPPHHLKNFPE